MNTQTAEKNVAKLSSLGLYLLVHAGELETDVMDMVKSLAEELEEARMVTVTQVIGRTTSGEQVVRVVLTDIGIYLGAYVPANLPGVMAQVRAEVEGETESVDSPEGEGGRRRRPGPASSDSN